MAIMNPYEQPRAWKYMLLIFAVIIAAGSLLYTRYLVRNIAHSERTRAQVWAISMQQLVRSDDDDNLQFILKVRDSLSVPAIVVDEKGDIKFSRGLDTAKTFIPNVGVAINDPSVPKYDPAYFKDELDLSPHPRWG